MFCVSAVLALSGYAVAAPQQRNECAIVLIQSQALPSFALGRSEDATNVPEEDSRSPLMQQEQVSTNLVDGIPDLSTLTTMQERQLFEDLMQSSVPVAEGYVPSEEHQLPSESMKPLMFSQEPDYLHDVGAELRRLADKENIERHVEQPQNNMELQDTAHLEDTTGKQVLARLDSNQTSQPSFEQDAEDVNEVKFNRAEFSEEARERLLAIRRSFLPGKQDRCPADRMLWWWERGEVTSTTLQAWRGFRPDGETRAVNTNSACSWESEDGQTRPGWGDEVLAAAAEIERERNAWEATTKDRERLEELKNENRQSLAMGHQSDRLDDSLESSSAQKVQKSPTVGDQDKSPKESDVWRVAKDGAPHLHKKAKEATSNFQAPRSEQQPATQKHDAEREQDTSVHQERRQLGGQRSRQDSPPLDKRAMWSVSRRGKAARRSGRVARRRDESDKEAIRRPDGVHARAIAMLEAMEKHAHKVNQSASVGDSYEDFDVYTHTRSSSIQGEAMEETEDGRDVVGFNDNEQILELVETSSTPICDQHQKPFTWYNPLSFNVSGPLLANGRFRNYGVVWPKDGKCSEEAPCPVVVSLSGVGEHSSGSTPEEFEMSFESIHKFGFIRYAERDPSCHDALGSVMIFPEPAREENWVKDGPELLEYFVLPLAHKVAKMTNRTVDMTRLSIIGYSEGAFGALHGAMLYPDVFAFAVGAALSTGPAWWQKFPKYDLSVRRHPLHHENWKLQMMMAAWGELDATGVQALNLRNTLGHLDIANVTRRVPLFLRFYANAHHQDVWDSMFNQWPVFHEIFWRGGYEWPKPARTSSTTSIPQGEGTPH